MTDVEISITAWVENITGFEMNSTSFLNNETFALDINRSHAILNNYSGCTLSSKTFLLSVPLYAQNKRL